MPEGIIVIADNDAASPHTRHAGAFVHSAAEEGRQFQLLESGFPRPDAAAITEALHGPDGEIRPLPAGTMLLVLAEPSYWFDLSRSQKNVLDGFYHYMLADWRAEQSVSGSAVFLCGRGEDGHLFDDIVTLHRSFCGKRGIIDQGIFRTACIDSLP